MAALAGAAALASPPAHGWIGSHVGLTLLLGAVLGSSVVAVAPARLQRSAAWIAVGFLGWSASLQLIDAPSSVLYQHLDLGALDWSRRLALGVLTGQLACLLVAGRAHLAAVAGWVRSLRRPIAILGAAGVAVLVSAVPSSSPLRFGAEVAASVLIQLLALLTLVAAARSVPEAAWPSAGRWVEAWLGHGEGHDGRRPDRWVWGVAALVTVVAAALAWFSYEAHPHVPDEVIYLLHARYLAEGMLTMPLPPVPSGFHVDLMYYEPTRWYSPVPPGWPMVLSLGVRLGAPWLVNPVLGGVAVVLTYLLLLELYPRRTVRLATLVLACSPWFLFMSMNFMTHALSLACALGASLGVARARRNGRLAPALIGGVLAGAVSLVRPLEGLVVAGLLGIWALGASGRLFRFAPAAVFSLGVIAVGALVRAYNTLLTGSPSVFPIMAYTDKYYAPGSNAMGFGANRGLGWPGLDPFPGHGPVDAIVNAVLNTAQTNVELLGWPVGGVALLTFGLAIGWRVMRRQDWWLALAIIGVVGAHSFYWFSGGPDFGARYWYLAIVPGCVLVARTLEGLEESVRANGTGARVRATASLLCVGALLLYVPWRAIGKYHHYRGMRPDVRELARTHDFGRSLVLVRGGRHPDYASAAAYNPIDLQSAAPVYAWDASAEIRAALLRAYPDRPVWILDGPSLTGGAFRIAAGPLSPTEALATAIPPDAAGSPYVYDPVSPPPR